MCSISEVAKIWLYKYTMSPRMCTKGHDFEGIVCLYNVSPFVVLMQCCCCLLAKRQRFPLVWPFGEFLVKVHKVALYLPH